MTAGVILNIYLDQGLREMVISKSDPRVILGSCKCWEIDDMKEKASKLRENIREAMQNPGFSG